MTHSTDEATSADTTSGPPPTHGTSPADAPPTRQRRLRWRWGVPRTFEGFRFPPFRWYMAAMVGFNAALSMQMLVRGYLAFQLTDSFSSLGIVSLGSAIPMLVLSPLGGVVADRWSRLAVLQLGQIASVFMALGVAALLFTGQLAFWHLVVSSIVQGVIFALVMPSRQALLPEVVGMQRLMNTVPLQSAGMNVMQIIAPALGGFMIDWVGSSWVYVSMAGMYVSSVITLFFVKTLSAEEMAMSRLESPSDGFVPGEELAPVDPGSDGFVPDDEHSSGDGSSPREGYLREMVSGVAYLMRDRTMLTIMSFSFLAAILSMPIRMLLPGYADAVFGDEGSTLGMLQMGMGMGALAGALTLATIRLRRFRGWVLAGTTLLMGVALLAFSMTGVFLLAWVGLLVVGIGSVGRQALGQVLLHEYVEDGYRGRVMAVYMMQMSLMSAGTFVVSIYMDAVGAQFAIGSMGAALIVATVAFLVLVPRLRRVA